MLTVLLIASLSFIILTTWFVQDIFLLTVVDCKKPADLSNATVSYNGTTFEETVNYTCEVGFRFPNGDKLLVKSCNESRNWTGPDDQCEG